VHAVPQAAPAARQGSSFKMLFLSMLAGWWVPGMAEAHAVQGSVNAAGCRRRRVAASRAVAQHAVGVVVGVSGKQPGACTTVRKEEDHMLRLTSSSPNRRVGELFLNIKSTKSRQRHCRSSGVGREGVTGRSGGEGDGAEGNGKWYRPYLNSVQMLSSCRQSARGPRRWKKCSEGYTMDIE